MVQNFSIALDDDDDLEILTPSENIRTIYAYSQPPSASARRTSLVGSAIIVLSFVGFALFSSYLRLEDKPPTNTPVAQWNRLAPVLNKDLR